jgi:hypothetical protein
MKRAGLCGFQGRGPRHPTRSSQGHDNRTRNIIRNAAGITVISTMMIFSNYVPATLPVSIFVLGLFGGCQWRRSSRRGCSIGQAGR